MVKVRVSRSVEVPDLLRVSRHHKIPELGPRVLFFSGGTALNELCQTLKSYTHNSTHLVTPFDSGGSSAALREAFDMPAIGDLRSRLMALADDTVLGHPEVYRLFTYRFDRRSSNKSLRARLDNMVAARDELVADISSPMRRLICNQLGYFRDAMPSAFNLRGASIGNLILAGGYLNNHKELDSIIFLFSKLVHVQGAVRAIVDDNLHLGAVLEDGSQVIGQHRLTGKEVAPLSSPIKRLFLSKERDQAVEVRPQLRKKNRKLIESADLICYPPGSFYSSVLANLLPVGVGRTIAANDCPKVYVPNLGQDPEQIGMNLERMIKVLLEFLRFDAGESVRPDALLSFVLLDKRNGKYPSRLPLKKLQSMGIQVVDAKLVSKRSSPYYDNDLLVQALLSLA